MTNALHRDDELRPYQRVGRDFLAMNQRALLLDAPGVGKTPLACAAMQMLGLKKVAVMCPAIARSVWRRHIRDWAPGVEEAQIESFEKWSRKGSTIYERLYNGGAEVLVVDEGHYLKSPISLRTKMTYGNLSAPEHKNGLSHKAQRTWVLTGTLMPNHAGESWTHLRAHHGEKLSYNGFLDRYCYTRQTDYGLQVMGNKPQHLPELREKIMRVSLRRKAEDVLPEMPPIAWGEWPVDPAASMQRAMQREDMKYGPALRDLLKAWTAGDFDDDEAMFAIRESEMHLATLRRHVGMAKAVVVAHAIADELREDPDMAVILFASHHDVIRELRECLNDFEPAVITGETPDKLREMEEMRFQSSPRCRVMIAQIQAAQTAITLTRANQVVIVEPSWSPEENVQAAKRAHRFGQERPVFVRIACLPNTLDEAIVRVLARKIKMVSQIMDGTP